jgi:hypothetical protein
MKQKAGRSRERRVRSTGSVRKEAEMPLDAEDLALASLEARLRAEESRVDLDSEEVVATLTICVPRPLFLRLLSRAARHNIAPSRLIELALTRYLRPAKAGRRGR